MKMLKRVWIPVTIIIVLVSGVFYVLQELSAFYGLISSLTSLSENNSAGSVNLEKIREVIIPLKNPVLHIGLAGEYRSVGDNKNAVAEYKTALVLDPANIIAHAGMVSVLLDEWMQAESDQTQASLMSALEEAVKAEPHNSFYNYARAAIYCLKSAKEPEPSDKGRKYEITDKLLAEQGLAEVEAGNANQYHNEYGNELGKAMLEVMKKTGRKPHPINKLAVIFSIRIQSVVYIKISDILAELSALYEKNGDIESSLKPLEASGNMGKRIAGSSKWLVSLLVGFVIQNKNENKLAEYYSKIGRETESIRMKEKTAAMEILRDELKKSPDDFVGGKYSLLDTLIIPSSSWEGYNPEIGCRMEYALLEMVLAVFLSVKIVVLILICAACWLYASYRAKKHGLKPFRITWKVKDLVFIYGFGLIIPLSFYMLYDRFHYMREFGLGNNALPWVLFQGEAVMLLILVLQLLLTAWRLREKLDAGSKPSPAAGDKMKRYGIFVWLLFLIFIVFFWAGINDRSNGVYWLMVNIAGMGAVIVTLTGWVLSVREITKNGELPKLYNIRAVYFKSMIPVLTGVLVLLAAAFITVILPYYISNTRKYESAVIDRLIEDEVGMTKWKQMRDLSR